jgi:chromosome partitioning protein
LGTIDLVARRLNERLRLSGVIYCLYESGTRLASEVTSDVDRYFEEARQPNRPWTDAQMFQTRIRRNIRLAEAPSFGQSIFGYAPDSHGATDYEQLAREVLSGAPAALRHAG